jgi:type I restriction enzyme S subunit
MANVGVIRYEDKGDVGNKKPDDLAKCKVVRPGNLVINSMNYGIGSYGLSPYSGVCSPVYIVLNPLKDVVDKRYALRVFEDKQFQAWAQSFGNGILAHRSAIGWDDLKNIKVALPPLVEQKILSRFLDHETAKIDALIREQERLIELLQEKRQAVISHAVTKGLDPDVPMKDSGVEWLGEVPAHWMVAKLGYYAEINTGATPDRSNPEYWNGDIPWIKTGEVNYKLITEAEEHITGEGVRNSAVRIAPPGTMLMAMYGQGVTRGRVAILGTHAAYNQACAAIAPNRSLNVHFLRWFMIAAYPYVRDDGNETSQMNLSSSYISKIPLVVPASDAEQEEIHYFLEKRVRRFAELMGAAKHSMELLKERRSALISAAVTGKIDVRNWQPPTEESAFDEEVRQARMEATV